MKKTMLAAASGLALFAATSADATTLLDVVNLPATQTAYSLSFVATAASVTLTVGGYDIPNNIRVTSNNVTLTNSATNLLSSNWQASFNNSNYSYQFNDGTSVNGLFFASFSGYDYFSQSLATTIGATYQYNFFVANKGGGQNGLRVSVDNANAVAAAVPEPAGWAMMIGGFGLVGGVLRRRRTAVVRVINCSMGRDRHPRSPRENASCG